MNLHDPTAKPCAAASAQFLRLFNFHHPEEPNIEFSGTSFAARRHRQLHVIDRKKSCIAQMRIDFGNITADSRDIASR
jgi:hypothetical protein